MQLCNSFDAKSCDIQEITVRKAETGQDLDRFEEIQFKMETVDNEPERQSSHEQEREKLEQKYYQCKAKIESLKVEYDKTGYNLSNTYDYLVFLISQKFDNSPRAA